jgi:hypothetical protein
MARLHLDETKIPPLAIDDWRPISHVNTTLFVQSMDGLDKLSEALGGASRRLASDFLEEQAALQKSAFEQAKAHARWGEQVRFPWCRIRLKYREVPNSKVGQLVWTDIRKHSAIPKSVKYHYLSGRDGVYDLKVLLNRAQSFDRELIVRTELRARQLRELMKSLAPYRKHAQLVFDKVSRFLSTDAQVRLAAEQSVGTTP